jgi:hypothetical protein
MKRITIKDAIIKVLETEKHPLKPSDIYQKIVELNLYTFKTQSPISIIASELRKNCVGIDLKKSRPERLFEAKENGKFILARKN